MAQEASTMNVALLLLFEIEDSFDRKSNLIEQRKKFWLYVNSTNSVVVLPEEQKSNRTQNYVESTVLSCYGRNGIVCRKWNRSFPFSGGGNGNRGVPQWSTLEGRPLVPENFQWSCAFHFHFTRLSREFWLNGKREHFVMLVYRRVTP